MCHCLIYIQYFEHEKYAEFLTCFFSTEPERRFEQLLKFLLFFFPGSYNWILRRCRRSYEDHLQGWLSPNLNFVFSLWHFFSLLIDSLLGTEQTSGNYQTAFAFFGINSVAEYQFRIRVRATGGISNTAKIKQRLICWRRIGWSVGLWAIFECFSGVYTIQPDGQPAERTFTLRILVYRTGWLNVHVIYSRLHNQLYVRNVYKSDVPSFICWGSHLIRLYFLHCK
jgi:hypothetical protein